MAGIKYNSLSSLRVHPEMHHRVKSLAALRGKSVARTAEELLEPAVSAEERRMDRLRAGKKPARTRPVA
jgi:hypothetical protein